MKMSNNLQSKWYNEGYCDAEHGYERRKLPYYLQGYYDKGYKQGRKNSPKKVKNFLYSVIGWLFITAIALVIYYCCVYLCADSPIVPIRCKAFPWE